MDILKLTGIDFAAIIKFDFVEKARYEETLKLLDQTHPTDQNRDIYSTTFSGLGETSKKYTVFEKEGNNGFEYYATIVSNDCEFIVDIISIAILSESQIQNILNNDNNINEYQEKLKNITIDINTFSKSIENIITYIHPNEIIDLFNSEKKIDIEKCVNILEENKDLLRKFKFNTNIISSIIPANLSSKLFENMITYQSNSVWGPLTILNTGNLHKFFIEKNYFQNITSMHISNEFPLMLKIFRGYSWLQYRLRQIIDFDKKTYTILSFNFQKIKYKKLLEEYDNFQELQNSWLKCSQELNDEDNEMIRITPSISEKKFEYKIAEFDIPIEYKYGPKRIGKYNSLISIYLEDLNYIHNKINEDSIRINNKIEMISKMFNERINIRTNKILSKHTIAMTIMTVIILLSTILTMVKTFNTNFSVREIANLIGLMIEKIKSVFV